jgi:hypothetical protein
MPSRFGRLARCALLNSCDLDRGTLSQNIRRATHVRARKQLHVLDMLSRRVCLDGAVGLTCVFRAAVEKGGDKVDCLHIVRI